jgi:hypothetical protein
MTLEGFHSREIAANETGFSCAAPDETATALESFLGAGG